MNTRRTPRRTRRRALRGVSLIDAMIAAAILAFGLVGLTRMQGRMVSQATDSQLRTTAVAFADELLNTALVDSTNAACYTLPQDGACVSPAAIQRTNDWAARVSAAMPGSVTRAVGYNAATGRMTVSIGWTAREGSDPRQLNVVTDVR